MIKMYPTRNKNLIKITKAKAVINKMIFSIVFLTLQVKIIIIMIEISKLKPIKTLLVKIQLMILKVKRGIIIEEIDTEDVDVEEEDEVEVTEVVEDVDVVEVMVIEEEDEEGEAKIMNITTGGMIIIMETIVVVIVIIMETVLMMMMIITLVLVHLYAVMISMI